MSRFLNVAESGRPGVSPNVNVHARKEAGAPASQSTVSTLSTLSSQSTSANRCCFRALTSGTTLAFEEDATFECIGRSHVEDHNSRLHA